MIADTRIAVGKLIKVRLLRDGCSEAELRFKRGTTITLELTLGDRGRYFDTTGYTITAAVVFQCDGERYLFGVTAAGAQVILTADTNEWPLGCGEFDLRLEGNGQVLYSESAKLHMLAAITEE